MTGGLDLGKGECGCVALDGRALAKSGAAGAGHESTGAEGVEGRGPRPRLATNTRCAAGVPVGLAPRAAGPSRGCGAVGSGRDGA